MNLLARPDPRQLRGKSLTRLDLSHLVKKVSQHCSGFAGFHVGELFQSNARCSCLPLLLVPSAEHDDEFDIS